MGRQHSDLLQQLQRLGEIAIPGNLVETKLTCGTKSCRCHTDPEHRHGPHLYLKYRDENGRSRSLYIRRSHEQEVREAVAAWSELREAVASLGHSNREELTNRLRSKPKGKGK